MCGIGSDIHCMYATIIQEQERQQRERNCTLLAKILNSMKSITYRTTWAEVCVCVYMLLLLFTVYM